MCVADTVVWDISRGNLDDVSRDNAAETFLFPGFVCFFRWLVDRATPIDGLTFHQVLWQQR